MQIDYFPDRQSLILRKEYLCRFSESKKIIHVSSVDHVPLGPGSMFSYFRMQQKLADCCNIYLDIDLGVPGILSQLDGQPPIRMESDQLFTEESKRNILLHNWDAILLNGVLEHLEDPLHFLRTIKKQYRDHIEHLLVIVPNALAVNHMRIPWQTDNMAVASHYYWFSPITLSNILHRAGFSPVMYDFAMDEAVSLNPVLKFFLSRNPMLQSHLIVTARC